jgi:hypothetical protein
VREAARCIAWTLAIGACALAFALFGSGGLEQAEGPAAWLLLAVYAPYYALVHARLAWPDAALMVAVFAAQFLWFLLGVVAVRRLLRRR